MKAIRVWALAVVAGLTSVPVSGADAWMKDENGVLDMMLAHEEKAGPDGGILRIDRNKKMITWTGAEGDIGCKQKVEATFDAVKSVVDNGREAGFVLEMKQGKPRKLVLLPLPYAEWFVTQWKVAEGKFGQTLPEGTLRTAGGRGESSEIPASGSAANAGPSLKHQDIPEQVESATNKAMLAVRDALGLADR